MTRSNGRNQYANVGGANFTYDARGNLTATGGAAYSYDAFNRLTGAGSAALSYDPAGRLYQVSASPNTTRFLYDGLDVIAEYNGANTLLRRYVHGPSFDEPVVWYEGSGTSDRRWLVADQLGSVVAATDSGGDIIGAPNTYDEYGRPGAANSGRFQYTGQMWLSEAGVYHYKARAYAPNIGAFLQTDPILYAGGMNLYAYVGADPVNFTDPLGLLNDPVGEIVITVGCPPTDNCFDKPFNSEPFGSRGANANPNAEVKVGEIVVIAKQEERCRWVPVRATGTGGPSGPEWDFLAPSPIRMQANGSGNAYNYFVYSNALSSSGRMIDNACVGSCGRQFGGAIGILPRTVRQQFAATGDTHNGLYRWRIYEGHVGEAGGVRPQGGPRGRGTIYVSVFRRDCSR